MNDLVGKEHAAETLEMWCAAERICPDCSAPLSGCDCTGCGVCQSCFATPCICFAKGIEWVLWRYVWYPCWCYGACFGVWEYTKKYRLSAADAPLYVQEYAKFWKKTNIMIDLLEQSIDSAIVSSKRFNLPISVVRLADGQYRNLCGPLVQTLAVGGNITIVATIKPNGKQL